ncbi:MAG TPA: N-acetylmuramoyl-L-alanine amidase [Oscillospiraceae bacterium]|nr:N-acetylmuramoyl-L-alanine amidase [Oscillospiraceae bacterium]HPR74881.1 N-acetylmuramoyl-L-alanine amidase [Oscillospiraceae bacterium]
MSGFSVKKAYTWAAVLLSAVIFLTFGVSENAARTAISSSDIDVIIDPGHGGVDGGAIGVTGSIEKEINLAISLYLRDILIDEGLNVLMIRSTDISIHSNNAVTIRQKKTSDLKNRLAIINANPDAVVISVHQNSFTAGYVHGTMIYYGTVNPNSKELAEEVKKSIQSLQSDNQKQLKSAGKNLYLMSNAKGPAVLVECGFLSNTNEEALLKTQNYQQSMAQSIADGVLAYFTSGIIDNPME